LPLILKCPDCSFLGRGSKTLRCNGGYVIQPDGKGHGGRGCGISIDSNSPTLFVLDPEATSRKAGTGCAIRRADDLDISLEVTVLPLILSAVFLVDISLLHDFSHSTLATQ
jgi:hypothetical protein